jgi:hypothetical protein
LLGFLPLEPLCQLPIDFNSFFIWSIWTSVVSFSHIVNPPNFILSLICNYFQCDKDIHCIISIFQILSKVVLWPVMWSVLESSLCVWVWEECAFCFCGVEMSFRPSWILMLQSAMCCPPSLKVGKVSKHCYFIIIFLAHWFNTGFFNPSVPSSLVSSGCQQNAKDWMA